MSLIGNLFKTQKTPSYNGSRPVTSLEDVQGGPEYYKTLQERMAGRGVGYGDNYTSFSNPQIAQLHNSYTGYELPELKSELSLTGRRAGSSGFQQISRSMSDQADKENSIMGQLMQRNAEASHNDVNSAITGMGSYATENANLKNNAANFDNNLYGQDTKNLQYDNSFNNQKAKDIGQAAVSLGAAPFTGGASLGMGAMSNPFSGNGPSLNGGFNPQTMSTMPYGYNMGRGGGSVAARVGQRGGY